jgi:hypothetical protein
LEHDNRNKNLHKIKNTLKCHLSQVWWCTPVILALRRLKQKDLESQATLDYVARPSLKKIKVISENRELKKR